MVGGRLRGKGDVKLHTWERFILLLLLDRAQLTCLNPMLNRRVSFTMFNGLVNICLNRYFTMLNRRVSFIMIDPTLEKISTLVDMDGVVLNDVLQGGLTREESQFLLAQAGLTLLLLRR